MAAQGGMLGMSNRIPTMINNPIVNRIAALVLLVCVYIAGQDTGHNNAVQAHHNHPVCHQNLKP